MILVSKDYIAITIHDNDFYSDLISLGVLLSHMITDECILDNECINMVTLENYILDIMIINYTLRTFGKTGYEDINKIKEYIENNLKIYHISKSEVIADDSEILYLCINNRMREFGEYFVI